MQDSRRYRNSAAECLLAAQEAYQPYYRKLHLSMAASWLSLARRDEAIDNLLASRMRRKEAARSMARAQHLLAQFHEQPEQTVDSHNESLLEAR